MTNPGAAAVSAALERLTRLHPKKIDLSLGRVERVLERLGRPQDRLPPAVHIAGTNGKGSVAAFLAAIAQAAGQKAHVYTSPHLVRFSERIRVAGEEIEGAALIDVLGRVEQANAGEPLTFFEATTAAAFLAFAETEADVAIIEVGLGGRYDATNVIDAPACAVVTPVGRDHMEFLGDAIAGIAQEKAGVFKPGRPAVIGPQEPEVRAVLVAEALRVGAEVRAWGADYTARLENDRLIYEEPSRVLDLPPPGLIGPHQTANAGVAVAAALASGAFSELAIGSGVASARWKGRLHRIMEGPLAEAAARRKGELWVDGAHNPMGAAALARALADLEDRDPRPLVLIAGLQSNKDAKGFFEAFQGLARGVACTPIVTAAAAATPDALAASAQSAGLASTPARDLLDAFEQADRLLTDADAGPRYVICGSLYLVGEALALSAGDARQESSA